MGTDIGIVLIGLSVVLFVLVMRYVGAWMLRINDMIERQDKAIEYQKSNLEYQEAILAQLQSFGNNE